MMQIGETKGKYREHLKDCLFVKQFDSYLHAKNWHDPSVTSTAIDEEWILQYD